MFTRLDYSSALEYSIIRRYTNIVYYVYYYIKFYDPERRRWMRTWDVLDEKEITMDIIKGYVEVNDDVENETMKYLGEVWTERQRNERNRVNVIH